MKINKPSSDSDKPIPFNKPYLTGNELDYIAECIARGHSAGDGEFTMRCQTLMEEKFSASKILLTNSCTSALEISAFLCEIDNNSEVLLPSYTFVSTANAFLMRGATLRFVDIREDTLNMDETLIEALVTPKSRAIVPVHYAGISCDMNEINRIAKQHNLHVIEDAAQGVNAQYNEQYLGTMGTLGTFSFHETKNFICGEGGALIINDEALIAKAEIIREKGTNRSQFFRGEIDKYTWIDVGSSYLPSDILAAFLYAQLENIADITTRRRHIYRQYHDQLSPLSERGIIKLPYIPDDCTTNYHMFYLLVENEHQQRELLQHLKFRGIHAVFHYVPLHTSPVGLSLGYQPGMLPVTEKLSSQLIRLPFYYELADTEILRITDTIKAYFN